MGVDDGLTTPELENMTGRKIQAGSLHRHWFVPLVLTKPSSAPRPPRFTTPLTARAGSKRRKPYLALLFQTEESDTKDAEENRCLPRAPVTFLFLSPLAVSPFPGD